MQSLSLVYHPPPCTKTHIKTEGERGSQQAFEYTLWRHQIWISNLPDLQPKKKQGDVDFTALPQNSNLNVALKHLHGQ